MTAEAHHTVSAGPCMHITSLPTQDRPDPGDCCLNRYTYAFSLFKHRISTYWMELLPSRTNTELFAVDFAVLLERRISHTQGEVISVMVGTAHKDRLKGLLWGRNTKIDQKCYVGDGTHR